MSSAPFKDARNIAVAPAVACLGARSGPGRLCSTFAPASISKRTTSACSSETAQMRLDAPREVVRQGRLCAGQDMVHVGSGLDQPRDHTTLSPESRLHEGRAAVVDLSGLLRHQGVDIRAGLDQGNGQILASKHDRSNQCRSLQTPAEFDSAVRIRGRALWPAMRLRRFPPLTGSKKNSCRSLSWSRLGRSRRTTTLNVCLSLSSSLVTSTKISLSPTDIPVKRLRKSLVRVRPWSSVKADACHGRLCLERFPVRIDAVRFPRSIQEPSGQRSVSGR